MSVGLPGPFVPRLVLEALVIVVSILAAFALDRWSEDRRAMAEERQVLEGLRTEFTAARDELERYRGLQRRTLNSVRLALQILQEARAAGATSAMVPDTALGLSYVAATAQPSLGTLSGLLASARLGVLRDPELRKALAGWGGAFEDLAEEEAASSLYVITQLDPVMRARVDVSPFRNVLPLFDETATEAPTTRSSRIPADLEIIGVLAGRVMFLEHGIEEYVDVLANVDRILERVDASLER